MSCQCWQYDGLAVHVHHGQDSGHSGACCQFRGMGCVWKDPTVGCVELGPCGSRGPAGRCQGHGSRSVAPAGAELP